MRDEGLTPEVVIDQDAAFNEIMRGLFDDTVAPYVDPNTSYETWAALPQEPADHAKQADSNPLSAEEQAVFDEITKGLQSPDVETGLPTAVTVERARRIPRVAKAIGSVAAYGLAVTVLSVVGTIGHAYWMEKSNAATPQLTAPTTNPSPNSAETTDTEIAVAQPAVPVVAEIPITTPETTVPFSAQAGEKIGTMYVEDWCWDSVEVYEQDESDEVYDSAEGEWKFKPDAPINRLTPDETPLEACITIEEYARANPMHTTRQEWSKPSSRGSAAQHQPVAVHERTAEGPRTVWPGQEGNAVIYGHGSTYSAPFADARALNPGSLVFFARSDERVLTYRIVGYEVIPADEEDRISNWSHPDSKSTLTFVNCVDSQGINGSNTHRLATRAVMVE